MKQLTLPYDKFKLLEEVILQYDIPIRKVAIGNDVLSQIKPFILELFARESVRSLVVCDKITYDIMGSKVEKTIFAEALVLDSPTPTKKFIDLLKNSAKEFDLIIAVGSGTINDLCKYTSFLLKKPYFVVATAPSMNGYFSANASIFQGGYKKSFAAHLPVAGFFDLDLLASAPKRLIRAGIGDSLCRTTSMSDWLVSHYLLGTYYDGEPFRWLMHLEKDLFDNALDMVSGDVYAMRILIHILLLSGLSMYCCDGSYPASQGEHMIAHAMEALNILPKNKLFHGEEIAVTTITMAMIQETILQSDDINDLYDVNYKKNIKDNLRESEKLYEHALSEYGNKIAVIKAREKVNTDIGACWRRARESISDVAIGYKDLFELMMSIGLATTSGGLGIRAADYERAVSIAKYLRNRYGFLDLEVS